MANLANSSQEQSHVSESIHLRHESIRAVELAKELQAAAASFMAKKWDEEQSLRQRALALDSNLRNLQALIGSAAKTQAFHQDVAEECNEYLNRARGIISEKEVSLLLPCKSHGIFLKMFIGPTNVRADRKDVRLKIKEEYYSYRDRTAYQFLLFPSVLLLLRSWVWNGCFPVLPVHLYQAWLLFLYTSLALRENILRQNGSNIRPWWIYHHYCAILMALVCLTWEIKAEPDCAQEQRGVQLFLAWAMLQGIAMLLQNRYQRQRLYTRIALGKSGRMDVVWGETAGVQGQLWLLCPSLFTLQAFEGYIGLLLLKAAVIGITSNWQVLVSGILLIVMAIGNFINTVQVLVAKSRVKAKVKRSKSKQQLDQVGSGQSEQDKNFMSSD